MGKKAAAALVLLFIFYPGPVRAAVRSERRPVRIVATLFPLAEFARQIVGERGEVHTLIPSGAEVHSWKPRPSDILRVNKADLFIYIGAALEPWVDDILKSVDRNRLTVIEASHGLDLIQRTDRVHHEEEEHVRGDGEAVDPHVWLDFEYDQTIVEDISRALIGISPEDREVFQANAAVYRARLEELDQRYAARLADCEGMVFVLGGHAAFGYLARRYKLRQISLFGLSPDARPTPRQMIRVVDQAREHRVRVIFFEVQVSDELAEIIAREAGVGTDVLNPGANLTPRQKSEGVTFIEIMLENLEALRNGLGRR